METSKQQFNTMLTALAEMKNVQLNMIIIAMFNDSANQLGYDRACVVLKEYFKDNKFPSINEFMAKAKGNADDTAEGTAIAGKIWKAVKEFGAYGQDAARRYLGEVGWECVENNGGWQSLCSFDEKQGPNVMASLRNSYPKAKATVEYKQLEAASGNKQLGHQVLSLASTIEGQGVLRCADTKRAIQRTSHEKTELKTISAPHPRD